MNLPEHDKLKVVQHDSQKLANFLDWIEEKGWFIAYWGKNDRAFVVTSGNSHPFKDAILAEYFEIDLDKLEKEKLAMIDEMRAENQRRANAQ